MGKKWDIRKFRNILALFATCNIFRRNTAAITLNSRIGGQEWKLYDFEDKLHPRRRVNRQKLVNVKVYFRYPDEIDPMLWRKAIQSEWPTGDNLTISGDEPREKEHIKPLIMSIGAGIRGNPVHRLVGRRREVYAPFPPSNF